MIILERNLRGGIDLEGEKKKRKKMAVIMVLGGNGQWNCQKFLSWAWNAGILGIGRGKWVISCVFRCLLVVLVVVT